MVLALLLVGSLGNLFTTSRLNIDSNILSLLPVTEADPAVEQAFANFSEQSMRRLVLLVTHPDLAAAKHAGEELAGVLRQNSWVTNVELRQDAAAQTAIGNFYFESRHHLLSSTDAALLEAGNYRAFSEDAIRQAYAPVSGGLIELMQRDPFLLALRAGTANAASTGTSLASNGGYLHAHKNGRQHVLVTAELVQSPFNRQLQQQILVPIAALEARWTADTSGIQLLRAGALFHTDHAYATASREVSLIGGGSLLCVWLLLILAFNSVRPLVLVTIALGFGVMAGFAAVRFVFGEVHLLTIVFGSSLVGVAEDYAFHYFVTEQNSSGPSRLRRILPAISLGLLTSVIGYAALFGTPFPGLQQMALFSITGLSGAWLSVVLLFPLFGMRSRASPRLLKLSTYFIALGTGRPARTVLALAFALPLLALAWLLTNELQPEDVRSFQTQDADLLLQEGQVLGILNAPAANQFYLVKGATPDQVLENLTATHARLDTLVAAGALDSWVSIAQWLPDRRTQDKIHALYQQLYASDAGQQLIDAGLITAAQLQQARAQFAVDRDQYLDTQEWLQSPVGRGLAYLWLDPTTQSSGQSGALTGNPEYASVIALRGIKQLDQLAEKPAGSQDTAIFIDKITTVNQMLASYRDSVSVLLAVACSAIFGILLLRYGVKTALLLIASPLIAISATVLGLALLDETLGLFCILALFLVMGIGVDFGIFFAEAEHINAGTLLAVLLSALTTIFAFGMLALSATSVIHSFGLSMLIGISSVLLLAPVMAHRIVNQSGIQR